MKEEKRGRRGTEEDEKGEIRTTKREHINVGKKEREGIRFVLGRKGKRRKKKGECLHETDERMMRGKEKRGRWNEEVRVKTEV